jgi:hypothetical protein
MANNKHRKGNKNNPRHNPPPVVTQQQPAKPQPSHVTVECHVHNDPKPEKKWSDVALHNKILIVLTLATMIVGTAVTVIYGLQLAAMHEAIDNVQENFIKENAPVIWVQPQPPTFKVDDLLRWNVQYTNYGHLTALNVHTCITAATGPKGFKAWDEIKFPPPDCDRPIRSSGVSPQNNTDYTTVQGDHPLSELQVSTINTTDGGAIVFGIITYDDIAGHSYETGFCEYRLTSGALMHCEKYNYVKRTR